MNFFENLLARLKTTSELLKFFSAHQWWWLTPMLALLCLGTILVMLSEATGLGPFVYSLF